MKTLLTGNEAVALGAYEAGVLVATGYPGTPATEIIEKISIYPDVYTEWSVNEKTALELASGVSLSGRRALVAMKHVGLNVASDPLMSLAYTGVNGGLVIAVSDDPGMWSSQNEQDSRLYGRIAHIPVLEPSDSEEAYVFVREAFAMSERFDLPVLLRLTRAISHTSTVADVNGKRKEYSKKYTVNTEKNVLLPPFTSERRLSLQRRMEGVRQYIPSSGLNRIENNPPLPPFSKGGKGGLSKNIGDDIGIITSGIAYQYVKEVMPEASVLKLGIVYPFNPQEIKEFARSVKELFVVEELGPFIEDSIRALGIKVRNGLLPEIGEMDQFILGKALMGNYTLTGEICKDNHATLCPGCPYLGVFYLLSKKSIFVGGDIGCYTLAVHTFPDVIDSTLCMGSGISQATGYSLSSGEKAVAVIGDSTFFHSGIPAVLNALYNKANILIIILDNHVIAMTGGQPHIGTGKGLMGYKKKQTIDDCLKGLGVDSVRRVDAYNLKQINHAVREGLSVKGVSAVIVDGECILKKKSDTQFYIDVEKCSFCGSCLLVGCKAIVRSDNSYIITEDCKGCGLCVQLCEKKTIKRQYKNNLCR
ncbi:MAG: indolepyruvate ferredoxin oxidoreductase subunit alpha [Nitrospira sp.]|nr:indolepyruvate ferredoxin oxidoreductase subunit alpha [Nitrospira sp.]